MAGQSRTRLALIAGSILIGILLLVPTIMPERPDWLDAITRESGAKLGLDLQGGMYLVLSVDTDEAVTNRRRNVRNELSAWLNDEGFAGEATLAGEAIALSVSRDGADAFDDWLENWGDALEIGDRSRDGDMLRATIELAPAEIRQIRDWAVLQSLETIRNRIDQYGVSEPSIQRQGDDRIVVQLPGIDDPQRAIELIGKTAQLTFHMLRDDVNVPELDATVERLTAANPELSRNIGALNAALAATLPSGVAVRYQRVSDEFGSFSVPVIVDAEPAMTGDSVVDARVRIDSQFNEPYVSLEFNPDGGKQFEQLTADHVGERMAIVLDETIYSAPVIRERIGGGVASIEGGFTIEEARDLAIVLRAGSLPAPVSIEEERTIGPSLGQDSIRRGVNAIAIGGLLVLVFMLIYYQYGGLAANLSLVANVIYLLGILSAFEATLTLPGLAGIVLTIGMAVDGNVIVFERIREELRTGKSVRAAVETGYEKALSTVLDANVTTLIAGLILFQFGTGPVRGFAVTLTVGILTTLFSVLIVSRSLIDLYVQRRGVRRLPI